MSPTGLFHLVRINMLAVANDNVLDATGDEDIAIRSKTYAR